METNTYTFKGNDYTILVEYKVYYDRGDYDTPSYLEIEPYYAEVNGEEVSMEFYNDWIHDKIEDNLYENELAF